MQKQKKNIMTRHFDWLSVG